MAWQQPCKCSYIVSFPYICILYAVESVCGWSHKRGGGNQHVVDRLLACFLPLSCIVTQLPSLMLRGLPKLVF